jgi:hypothetical protein
MWLARLDRDVRRALIHRKPSIAGVTAGDGVTGTAHAQSSTMRLCPSGLVAVSRRGWRAAPLALIRGNGSGPDGSILTLDYRRSKGLGAEKMTGSHARNQAATFVA